MKDGIPSRTAERVAMHRAVHQVLDAPLIFADPLALRILGAETVGHLRRDTCDDASARAMRAQIVVRSRRAEDALAFAVQRGVRQYVVLGAGLDTFAYRNPYAELRVFEIDHPATQAWKRAMLHAARIPIPTSETRKS